MSQQPAQTTNTESIRKLKDLTGGKQLGPVPRAMHMTRQFDADWRNSTPLDTEAEAVLRGLRPNLEHLSPTIGTVVHGVDLSQPMAPPLVRALRRLLLERKAIFFREQHLTPAQQLRFARGFGELEIHPFTQGRRGFPELLSIEHGADSVGGENVFHSDVTWRECPSLGSVLYAREVPSASACGGAGGGDTLFVDAYAMAEAIEPGLRAKIEGLTAEHDSHFFRAGLAASGTSPEEPAAVSPGHPDPPGDGPEAALRQPCVYDQDRGSARRGAGADAGLPLRPSEGAGVCMQVSVGGWKCCLLGQPCHAALRIVRLLPVDPQDGSCDYCWRQALLPEFKFVKMYTNVEMRTNKFIYK